MHDSNAIFESDLSPAEIEAFFDDLTEKKTTPCCDGDLVWRIWGSGPPLVLLHGGYGSWRHWIRNIFPLGARHTLYIVDIPGLGDSATVPRPYNAGSLAKIMSDGLNILLPDGEPFSLCGFSFGGLLSGHVAMLQGKRCEHLVMIGPGGLGIPNGGDVNLKSPLAHMTDEDLTALHRHNLSELMIFDPDKIDELAIHLQAETIKLARTRSRPIARTDTLRRVLPCVSAKVHAIHGEFDKPAAPQLGERERLMRVIHPDLDYRIIKDAGHWVMYETPAIFNNMLLDMVEPA